MTAPEFLALLDGVRKSGDGWTARCKGPGHAHGDVNPSLSVTPKDDRFLIRCHTGCKNEEIVARMGLTMADLFYEPRAGQRNGHAPGARTLVKAYRYEDADGTLLYENCRYEPKDFRQRRPKGEGDYTWTLGDVKRVVYRLPELAEEKRIFLVEGEKDADNLWTEGLPATTVAGGAKNWRPEFAQQIRDAGADEVVILPDNDAPGRAFAAQAAAALHAVGIRVKVVTLPDLEEKGDVTDWLAIWPNDHAELTTLVEAAPHYVPDPDQPAITESDYIQVVAVFLAEQDPPMRAIFPDLLPMNVIMLMHGEPRARKSLAAFELALAASIGEPPFGLERFRPPAAMPVLYVQEEDPRQLTRPRLRALIGARCARPPERLHVAVRRGIDLDDGVWVQRLIGDLQRLGARLLVLDAARRLSAKTDEGPAKVRELMAVLRSIVIGADCSIVVVHHDVKPPSNGQEQRRRSQRASGGDWFAACECPVHVEKIGGETLVFPEDYKFTSDPAPFTFQCETTDGYISRLVGTDTDTEHAERAGIRGRVLDWLRVNGPATKSAMKKAGLGRWETIEGALELLAKEGKVDAAPGKRAGSQRYFATVPTSRDATEDPRR